VTARTFISHPTEDKHKQFLMVVIEIACSLCEVGYTLQVPGHHIPATLKALEQAQADYPDLCKAHVEEVPAETIDKAKVM
jgi:hypothetical protein